MQHRRALGAKRGSVMWPATPPEAISEILDGVDVIVGMSVNPGVGGQKFLHSKLPKISRMRDMITQTGRDIRLAVDGGIDATTAPLATKAGADVLIAGSAIYAKPDYKAAIAALRPENTP